VNDPTAEDLNLPLHDFVYRKIDLEAPDCLEPHLGPLHNLAGDQPRAMVKTIADPQEIQWPRISVVVCSYNGARTIRATLEGLLGLDYPAYEVIVVDDGSTDDTASVVQAYGFRLIRTENRGLSNARNTGMQAAQGEIVAYIDDDAYPAPNWLTHLATTFIRTNHAGVGGPHLAADHDGWIADCVGNAPGGPVHVLLADQGAEHIPGCNMAFRKSTLQSIGGFDPRYRAAGEDVDVCWRLQRRGWTLGFHPAAVVWHHRHNSVRRYWHEQKKYGYAEALLEEKWPLKYNEFGHLAWSGRLDGKGLTRAINARHGHLYRGTWSHAMFQCLSEPAPNVLCVLPLMPAWYLLVGALAVLAVLSVLWPPLLYSLPLLLMAVGAPLGQAVVSAYAAVFTTAPLSRLMRLKCRFTTAFLYLIQPIARLYGRLSHSFTRWRGHPRLDLLWPRTLSLWHETWRDHTDHLQFLETVLGDAAFFVQPGSTRDRWELEVRGGLFGKVRTRLTIAAPEADQPLIRVRAWPMGSSYSLALCLLFALLCVGAILDQAYVPAVILGGVALTITYRRLQESAWAMSSLLEGFKRLGRKIDFH
jgi:GT2 family glycosyltransferase